MALADLDSIQFYRPPTEASQPRKRVAKVSSANDPTIAGSGEPSKAPTGRSSEWSVLWSDHPIEFINLIDLPSKEQLDPSPKGVPDFKDIETNAKGKVLSLLDKYVFVNGLDISNAFCDTGELDHSIGEDHEIFPTFEELLFDAEKTKSSVQAGLRGELKEGHLVPMIRDDCGGVISPISRRSDDNGRYIRSICQ